MQPHEGPSRDRKQEDAEHQRLLTRKLLLAIGILSSAVIATLVERLFR